jgi:hypothetical protein
MSLTQEIFDYVAGKKLSEVLDEQLKLNVATFSKMSPKTLIEGDCALKNIFKAGYTVVLKQSQHRDTLTDLAKYKALIDLAMESLDDDETTMISTGKKLNEGQKLTFYNFLGNQHSYYIDTLNLASVIELVKKTNNNEKKILKHLDAYTEQVKSKLEKMVQKIKKEAEEKKLRELDNKISKLENEVSELEKVVEETDEDTVKVHEFEHEGTTYLRDENTNILYDIESQDEVGVWNAETKTIDEIEDDDE